MYDKWNHIGNQSLLYHLLFTVSGVVYCMCLSVNSCWISYSISYSLFYLLLLLTQCLLLNYAQLYQIFPNASITSCYTSYNSCFTFCLVLFAPIYCINYFLVSATLFSLVLRSVSATRINPFYLLSNCISYSYKILLSTHRLNKSYLHSVTDFRILKWKHKQESYNQ